MAHSMEATVAHALGRDLGSNSDRTWSKHNARKPARPTRNPAHCTQKSTFTLLSPCMLITSAHITNLQASAHKCRLSAHGVAADQTPCRASLGP